MFKIRWLCCHFLIRKIAGLIWDRPAQRATRDLPLRVGYAKYPETMKITAKTLASAFSCLFLTVRSLLAEVPSSGGNDINSHESIWIKDCMGREVPAGIFFLVLQIAPLSSCYYITFALMKMSTLLCSAALLENDFCDSFPLKHLVSYKSHDSSEANNEAHALGVNLDCMKLAFGKSRVQILPTYLIVRTRR